MTLTKFLTSNMQNSYYFIGKKSLWVVDQVRSQDGWILANVPFLEERSGQYDYPAKQAWS